MAEITFLLASDGTRLSKTYCGKMGTLAYPKTARFTSESVTVSHDKSGMIALKKAIEDAGQKGAAMLKGKATRVLKNNSRKNLCDKSELTDHIVIDVDNLVLDGVDPSATKVTKTFVENVAEKVITEIFPEYMHKTSYVVGLSPSFGRKETVNLHFHFLLKDPVPPYLVKEWLKYLNLQSPVVYDQLELTKTKKTLKWIIDPVTANNSQLIYIADPIFRNGEKNPLSSRCPRTMLVKKPQAILDLSPVLAAVDQEVVKQKTETKIKSIHKALGISYTKPVTFDIQNPMTGETVRCLHNPPKMNISYSSSDGTYARFNINGGDSNAYWCFIEDPRFIHSFKGEDSFLFEAADKEAYDVFTARFKTDIKEASRAMVVHDIDRDTYVKVRYEPATGELLMLKNSRKDSVNDYLVYNAVPVPDIFEPWNIYFDPTKKAGVDSDNKKINTFLPTKYMLMANELPGAVVDGLGYGTGVRLNVVAPTIHALIHHVIGGEVATYEHFINWLAYVFQYRRKTGTAWLLQGTQGTGKGLLYKKIIHPLFNNYNSPHKAALETPMDTLDDQFNGIFEGAIVAIIDEFRADNAKAKNLVNRLKNAITEEEQTVRRMFREGVQQKSFCNFIFTSNDSDAIRIAADDRRYNIAEAQRMQLHKAIPDLVTPEYDVRLESELPLFAMFLGAYEVDKNAVKFPINNKAKSLMREASADHWTFLLTKASEGDLTPFVDIIESVPTTQIEQGLFTRARSTALRFLAYANTDEYCTFTREDLKCLFCYYSNMEINQSKWNKLLARTGLNAERLVVGNQRKRAFARKWAIDEDLKAVILSSNLTDTDVERMLKEDNIDLKKYKDAA